MVIDERLRQLADQVPAPPPGDGLAAFRRGVRRRRLRRGASLVGVVAVIGVVVASASTLLTGPSAPHIVDQPGSSEPVIRQAPAATVSSSDPFPWAVAVSLGDDDRWCVTTVHGSTEIPDVIGDPCEEFVPPDETGYWMDVGRYGVEAPDASGAPSRRVAWGFGRGSTDEVVVEFTDGSREDAVLGTARPSIDATLWAIGYEDVEVQGAEASTDDGRGAAGFQIHHGGIPVGFVVGAAVLLAAALLVWARGRRHRAVADLPDRGGGRRLDG